MSSLNETPRGERLHISIFGRRNSGKSSLINALTGQTVAIVSDVPGTTTDPVAKSMEILPIGPVVIYDTAGIDDVGALGARRVEASRRVLEKTDLAILVIAAGTVPGAPESELLTLCRERRLPVVVVANKCDTGMDTGGIRAWTAAESLPFVLASARDGAGVLELKNALIEHRPSEFAQPTIIGDLIRRDDTVVLVIPIDSAAPKGRIILPQVMVMRDILDNGAHSVVCTEAGLATALSRLTAPPRAVVTDSQAFHIVSPLVPRSVALTGFSVLMARFKGDLTAYVRGLKALEALRPGDRVLIAEGCTHHRQEDDIGTVKIPRLLRERVGGAVEVATCSGIEFPKDVDRYNVVIHCGACTLNRREVLYRQRQADIARVPMANYGMTLAWLHGVLDRALEPFPDAMAVWKSA